MHFSASTLISVLAVASAVIATPMDTRVRDQGDDSNPDVNIFPNNDDAYNNYAICKGKITKSQFPNLDAPSHDGGCVRYFPGIDITGVVTMVNLYFNDGIKSACDCAAKCLDNPTTCTNWVYKHTFVPQDSGKRSCTLYSSPNLPKDVTLVYDLHNTTGLGFSVGTGTIGMNPQAGCDAPQTFLDAANTQVDKYGVSGFAVRDTTGRQFC